MQSGLKVTQKDHDPCSEANKNSEAFGKAILGGLAGAAAGALLGALIGKVTKSDVNQSAKIGALLGLGAGVVTGYNSGIDSYRRQCEVYKVVQRNNTTAAFATLSTGKETTGEIVVTPDQGHFVVDSDQLTDAGRAYFADLARQYTSQVQLSSYEKTVRSTADKNADLGELKSYTATADDRAKLETRWRNYRIVITGHTDDQRDAATAQILSEKRAHNVADIFKQSGVPESSLLYQGSRAAFPIADNRTLIGRQKNNRVEAVVLYDEKTLLAYTDSRQPNYEYFSERPVEAIPTVQKNTTVASRPTVTPKQPTPQAKLPVAPNAKAVKPPAPSTTLKPIAPVAAAVPVEPGMDFGAAGVPVASYSSNLSSRLGKIKSSGDGLMIDTFTTLLGIGTASAAVNNVIENCNSDDPLRHRPGQIKKLSDGSAVSKTKAPISMTDSYLFNTVQTGFRAPAGDHFVEVKNVTVRKTGELVEDPQFNLYLNFRTKSYEEKLKAKTPDYTTTPVTYSLLGEGGVLIRQFFLREKGLVCMDLLIPNDRSAKVFTDNALVYNQAGVRKVANLTMER